MGHEWLPGLGCSSHQLQGAFAILLGQTGALQHNPRHVFSEVSLIECNSQESVDSIVKKAKAKWLKSSDASRNGESEAAICDGSWIHLGGTSSTFSIDGNTSGLVPTSSCMSLAVGTDVAFWAMGLVHP